MGIVIVDDSATNLIVLKRLAQTTCEVPVLTFTSALAGIEFLAGNAASLILVDCEMPDMDGIQFISTVRSQWHHAVTPIIMVTRHTASDIRQKALMAGANEFLSKPLNSAEFKVRVGNYLKMSTSPFTPSDKIDFSSFSGPPGETLW